MDAVGRHHLAGPRPDRHRLRPRPRRPPPSSCPCWCSAPGPACWPTASTGTALLIATQVGVRRAGRRLLGASRCSGSASPSAAMFGLSLAFGVITAFDNPARRAFVVELVPDDDVPNAVGLNSALMTGSRIVGPALAGVLIAGPGVGVLLRASTPCRYMAVIGALLRMNRARFRPSPPGRQGQGPAPRGPALRCGNRPTCGCRCCSMAGRRHAGVQLPGHPRRCWPSATFHGDGGTFTLLFSVMSLGSVLGALAVARAELGRRALPGRGRLSAWRVSTLALALSPDRCRWRCLRRCPSGFSSISVISGVQRRRAAAGRPADAGPGAGALRHGVPRLDADRRPDRRLDGRA